MSLAERLNKTIPLTLDESGWAYDGPFSTYKEFHSATLGFGAGMVDDPAAASAVVAWAAGRGSRKSRDDGERAAAHWRQVAEEPAYALGAMSVGKLVRTGGINPAVIDVIGGVL